MYHPLKILDFSEVTNILFILNSIASCKLVTTKYSKQLSEKPMYPVRVYVDEYLLQEMNIPSINL